MNNHWAFLPMQESNDLLGDPPALRARLADDGYLYFRKLLDESRVRALRKRMLVTLAEHGWVSGARGYFMAGRCVTDPIREGEEAYLAAYDDIQKLEAFHTLAHDETLVATMREVLGDSAFPHPLKIARLSFPDHYEASTPPHQDYPNNQGTEALTATWIPVGEVPYELGGLAILRGSQRWDLLPLDVHLGAGNRQAVLPLDMLEQCRWVTTEYSMGDVLLFNSKTVHASMHNASEFYMRLSVDFRWQREGEALTPLVLEPHFQRLTWEDIYEGWESTRHQYYWKSLDYEIVPFEDLPVDGRGHTEMTNEEIARFVAYERRRDARAQRRLQALAEVLDPGADGASAPDPPGR
jgi:ectoine hydroxylase-related dioxygenase (phytanoyl-CoA dioxygenase family)